MATSPQSPSQPTPHPQQALGSALLSSGIRIPAQALALLTTLLWVSTLYLNRDSIATLLPSPSGDNPPRSLSLTMETDAPEPEEEPTFVPVNPDVASQDPGPTERFSTKDQVAAQEEVPDESLPEDLAFMEGPLEQSVATYSGNPFVSPFPENPVAEPGEDEVLEDPQTTGEKAPPTPVEPQTPDSDRTPADQDGEGITLPEDDGEDLRDIPSEIVITARDPFREMPSADHPENEAETVEAEGQGQRTLRPEPRPRRQVQHGMPLVTGQDQTQAPNIGRAAVEARESAFGHYLDRMKEAIIREWHRTAWDMNLTGESGAKVRVRFRIDREGHIEEMEILESTTRGTIGTLIIQDAIRSRAPYGPWPEQMITLHGDTWETTITFHYR
ncbi:MAG: hypothetical protein LAT55_04185 [Opitutales bacterium]|nr:hypothetical protein [Opitutales bacterium]